MSSWLSRSHRWRCCGSCDLVGVRAETDNSQVSVPGSEIPEWAEWSPWRRGFSHTLTSSTVPGRTEQEFFLSCSIYKHFVLPLNDILSSIKKWHLSTRPQPTDENVISFCQHVTLLFLCLSVSSCYTSINCNVLSLSSPFHLR